MKWLLGASSLLLIALDRFVKIWAESNLKGVASRPIIEGVLGFAYVENRGMAFGLFQGGRWLFVPLTVVIVGVIIFFYARLPMERRYWLIRVPLILVFAGAAGNFADRAFRGYVVDMFEFLFVSFPVFNVADMCVTVGTFSLAFVTLFIIKDVPLNGKG